MKKKALFITLIFACVSLCNVFAQSSFNSEDQLLKEAHNLYVSNQYAEAVSLYAQLLSTHPKDPTLSYYYGVSLLLSSKNKAEAVRNLELAAAANSAPSLVHYYLAKAYHQNYQFDKAVTQYDYFKKNSNSFYVKELQVDDQINMCNTAINYDFKNRKDLIISQSVTDDEHFSNAYVSAEKSGSFLLMPDKFNKGKANQDKFSKYVFLSSSGKELVFSAPGKTNSIDIFIAKRKSANDWKPAEPVLFNVEVKGDKLNPTIADDGKTIYFSLMNDKCIGGFDIFKSTLISGSTIWSEPVNIGPPANSPEDDFYYVPSTSEQVAYVYSKRDCEAQKVNVLKLKLMETDAIINVPLADASTTQKETVNNDQITEINKKEAGVQIENKFSQIPATLTNAPTITEATPLVAIIAKEEAKNTPISTESKNEVLNSEIKKAPEKEDVKNKAEKNKNIPKQQPPKNNEDKEKRKNESIIIKGVFYAADKPSSMNAKIIAVNSDDQAKVYSTETDTSTGEYLLQLPHAGPYNFNVEKENYQTHSQTVTIQKGKTAEINQQILINKDKEGRDKLLVMQQNENNQALSEKPMKYKIQIGAFLVKPVDEVLKKFTEANITEVTFLTRDNGMHVFYSGETTDFFAAMAVRKKLMEKGISDAFVVVFMGEQQMSVADALLSTR